MKKIILVVIIIILTITNIILFKNYYNKKQKNKMITVGATNGRPLCYKRIQKMRISHMYF